MQSRSFKIFLRNTLAAVALAIGLMTFTSSVANASTHRSATTSVETAAMPTLSCDEANVQRLLHKTEKQSCDNGTSGSANGYNPLDVFYLVLLCVLVALGFSGIALFAFKKLPSWESKDDQG